MSDNKVTVQKGGIGFMSMLTLIFVVAKIGGFITWSWWLVFAPILFSIAFVTLFAAMCILVVFLWGGK